MINNITLVGRLTNDPELKYIPGSGTPVAKFTIAVNRDYKDKEGNYPTDFIPVEVMGKSAEYVSNYITKGRLVGVVGSVRVERYEKDGEKKTFTKVQARNVQGLESAKNADVGATPVGFSAVDDDDVPF